jgi:hypothetical protein
VAGQRLEEADDRMSVLVRMLVGEGDGAMVAGILAEFAAICDHLLAPLPTRLLPTFIQPVSNHSNRVTSPH